MDLTSIIDYITAHLPAQYAVIVSCIVAVCATLSTTLPAPTKTNGVYFYFYKVVNFIGLNLGHATNAAAPK